VVGHPQAVRDALEHVHALDLDEVVTVPDLIARPWEQVIRGQKRQGISFGASTVLPASAVQAA
jgi:hypothetical protein